MLIERKAVIKSIIKWGSVFILFVGTIAVITINVYAYKLNAPDHTIDEFMESLGTAHVIHRRSWEGKTIRYVETGLQESWAPLILFVHGAPGTLDAFKHYLADYDLNKKARLIAVDRLGYGGSDYSIAEPNIEFQAQAIVSILDSYNASNVIVVSHSYGSPISVVMASSDPQKVQGLLMVSPVNDPVSEPVKWYAYLANWKIMRWILPAFIDVSTTEKLAHPNELKKIAHHFDNVTCPVVHYHGTKDILAPFTGNVEYSKKHIKNINLRIIEEAGGGHLLIWTKGATVKNMIIDLLDEISD